MLRRTELGQVNQWFKVIGNDILAYCKEEHKQLGLFLTNGMDYLTRIFWIGCFKQRLSGKSILRGMLTLSGRLDLKIKKPPFYRTHSIFLRISGTAFLRILVSFCFHRSQCHMSNASKLNQGFSLILVFMTSFYKQIISILKIESFCISL